MALNFPYPAYAGNTYVGPDNGVTYTYDGVKWIGNLGVSSGSVDLSNYTGNIIPSANVTYSLGTITHQWKDLFVSNSTIYIGGVPLSINGDNNLTVNGNLVSGSGGSALTNNGYNLTLGTDGNLTVPGSINSNTTTGNVVLNASPDGIANYSWTFDDTGELTLPKGSTVDNANGSVAINTQNPNIGVNAILNASYGIPAGTYTNQPTTALTGAGAGMTVDYVVVVNPGGIDSISIHTPGLGYANGDQITIPAGIPVSGAIFDISVGEPLPNTWTFGQTGELRLPYGQSIGSGSLDGIKLTTDRGTILFGNSPECVPTALSHFHIMKDDPTNVDLFFGDDLNYVKLPGDQTNAYGVEIGTNNGSAQLWRFGTDGTLTLPDNSRLNSGGINVRNSAEIKTTINRDGGDPSIINTSEIALQAGNGGISAQVLGPWTGGADGSGGPTLVYAGVENLAFSGNGPGFAGFVAIDPNVTSFYSVDVDAEGKIYINVGAPLTTSGYIAALGVLTSNINLGTGKSLLNGIAVTSTQTALTGNAGISISTDGGTWRFGTDGNLTFPNGDLTIGHDQFGDPAIIGAAGKNIGLVSSGVGDGYDIGSSLIWVDSITEPTKIAGVTANNPLYVGAGDVGIVTGDYFYTGNTNVWNFGADGNLILPVGGDILDSNGTSVLGGGGGTPYRIVNGASYASVPDLNGNVYIVNNDTYTWIFGNTGILTLPATTPAPGALFDSAYTGEYGVSVDITNNGYTVEAVARTTGYLGLTTSLFTNGILPGEKKMFSIYVDRMSNNRGGYNGIGIGTHDTGLETYLGENGDYSHGFYEQGAYYGNLLGNNSPDTFTDNDIIDIAVDQVNFRIWMRKNGGNWNNNPSADPATNVGGFETNAWSVPVYPGVTPFRQGGDTGNKFTIQTTAAYSVPSGFTFFGLGATPPNIVFPDGSEQYTAWTGVSIGTDAPANTTGSQWYNTDDGRTYVYNGSTWVDSSPEVITPQSFYTGNLEFNDTSIISDTKTWTFGTDGTTTFPQGSSFGSPGEGEFSLFNLVDTDFAIYTNNGNNHSWLFGSDGYLTTESIHVQGSLKGVDGSTGSTGQVLTRQNNGGVAWADSTGGGGSNYSNANVASYLTNASIATFSNANVASYLVANPQGGTFSNANVASYLTNASIATFSNANVAAYLIENPPAAVSNYGNANVATYLANYDGSITFTASTAIISNVDVITVLDHIRSPSYQFANGANILGDITFSGSDITGTGANVVLEADTQTWTFDSTGDLTVPGNMNLPQFKNIRFGNTSTTNYILGENDSVSLHGGTYGGNITSSVYAATSYAGFGINDNVTGVGDGGASVQASLEGNAAVTIFTLDPTDLADVGYTWTFDANGTLTLPSEAKIMPGSPVYGTVSNMATLVGENVYLSSTDGLAWAGIETGVPKIGTSGGVWRFGIDGNLTLPTGSTIGETANVTVISPPGALMGQSLVIRPTAVGILTSDHPSGFADGDSITLTIQPNNGGHVTGTVGYTFTGATAEQLGRALTGTLTFTDQVSQTLTWTIPSNSNIDSFTFTLGTPSGFSWGGPGNTYITLTRNGSSEDYHIHLVTGDPAMVDLYLGDDDQYVKIEKNGGNVIVGTDSNNNQWKFGIDGSLALPTAGNIIQQGYNLGPYQVQDGNWYGGDTAEVYINFADNPGLGNIVLPGDTLIDANNISSTTSIVSVTTDGSYWTVTASHAWLSSNPSWLSFSRDTSVWRFGADGSLNIPSSAKIMSGYPGKGQLANTISLAGEQVWLANTSGATYIGFDSTGIGIGIGDRGWTFDATGNLTLPIDGKIIGQGADANVYIETVNGGNVNTWTFGNTGNLTFPDNTVQTTAYTGNNVPVKTGGFVAQNTAVSIDSITAQWLNTGAASANQLSLAALNGNVSILYTYTFQDGTGGSTTGGSSSTTLANLSFGWTSIGNPSGVAGDMYNVLVSLPGTNAYRITAMTGSAYSNNVLTIERLI